MGCKKIAICAIASSTGETGGAERFYEGLAKALLSNGMEVETVSIVSDESSFEPIEETYLRFYDLDLSRFDGVISTKAPSYLIRHPNHVSYLVHTMRAFYDLFEYQVPRPTQKHLERRARIHRLDTTALRYPHTKKVFVIGNQVRDRLKKYNGIDAEVLYPALTLENLHNSGRYQYLLMPGRLSRWKRVDLVIKAMKFTGVPLVLKISGAGESEGDLEALADGDERVQFVGRVSDDELADLYADALAVPFVPIMEDYGLVTLEAYTCGKPIITCSDSGEPARMVRDGVSGFVCPPKPKLIAKKLEYFYKNPDKAEEMGMNGCRSIEHITWEKVAQKLLSALGMN